MNLSHRIHFLSGGRSGNRMQPVERLVQV